MTLDEKIEALGRDMCRASNTLAGLNRGLDELKAEAADEIVWQNNGNGAFFEKEDDAGVKWKVCILSGEACLDGPGSYTYTADGGDDGYTHDDIWSEGKYAEMAAEKWFRNGCKVAK